MMKVFDIKTPFTHGQTHSVVAPNMATAETVFLRKYPRTQILEISLHSEYVQVSSASLEEARNDRQ